MKASLLIISSASLFFLCCKQVAEINDPSFELIPAERILFNSMIDCNMAEAWVGDTFRIFPGKYGEDPVWGEARDLKMGSGKNAIDVFKADSNAFAQVQLPMNVAPNTEGLHGAVWFETIYQDEQDKTGKTLYAIYHNENYPATLPYNEKTGKGYKDSLWPQGLRGPQSAAAVCRIGVMKSNNGGHSWENKGIFIEDEQPNMILKPQNNALTFAGGVGDPSAVRSGDSLYLFYGEYGYPGKFSANTYNAEEERKAQCVSVARIAIKDLENPQGKAFRWNGNSFSTPYNQVGKPISSLMISTPNKGGAASKAGSHFYWGPSVSWNTYLNCWVMLMGRVENASWKGSNIYISFNKHQDLGKANNAQDWSAPKLLLSIPGHTLWYPSLQPMNTTADIQQKNTCLRLGKEARLFVKNMTDSSHEYASNYIIRFKHTQSRNP